MGKAPEALGDHRGARYPSPLFLLSSRPVGQDGLSAMAPRALVVAALAACASAGLLPPRSEGPGFVSCPISHRTRTAPARLAKRSADIALTNVSTVSYLISRKPARTECITRPT